MQSESGKGGRQSGNYVVNCWFDKPTNIRRIKPRQGDRTPLVCGLGLGNQFAIASKERLGFSKSCGEANRFAWFNLGNGYGGSVINKTKGKVV